MTPVELFPDTNQASTAAIGQRLRRARERQGLELAHMARELHLQPRQIQALEAGDFSGFNSPAFIKGYLRAFARMLNYDGDELVRLYEATDPSPRSSVTVAPVLAGRVVAPSGSTRRGHSYFAALGVAILVTAIAVYLNDQWGAKLEPLVANVPLSALTNSPHLSDAGLSPSVDNSSEDTVSEDTPSADALSGEVTPPALPVSTDVDTLAAASGAAAVDAVALGDAALPGVEAPATEGETSPEVVSAPAAVQFTFTGDCWVQVRGADGVVVHEKLHKAGETASVDAPLPLNIWFGNATVVSMRHRGVDVAVPVKPGYQSARFVLDHDSVTGDFE